MPPSESKKNRSGLILTLVFAILPLTFAATLLLTPAHAGDAEYVGSLDGQLVVKSNGTIYLVQNGISIGAILGYVISQGAGANILTFVFGHGTFELGAIVICGGAGLSLGWAIVAPGQRTRLASVQHVSRDLFVIVCGASVMLLIAAGLEAFWSPSSLPSSVKQIVGALFLVLVMSYLALAGRGGPARPEEAG